MKKYCPFCQNEIKNNDGHHIYRCNASKGSVENPKYEYIAYNFPYLSSHENLRLEYEEKLKSLPDLKKEFGVDSKSLVFLLDYFKIKKRTISESSHLISRSKYLDTCQKLYGVNNVSSLDSVKKKKQKTFIEHYGVDNIWKTEEYREWLNAHMLEKYNAKSVPNVYGNADSWGWNKLTKEQKEIRIRSLHSNFASKLEVRIHSIIKSITDEFIHQYFINGQSFDFYIGNKKLIEVNGDYWHANPALFKEDEKFFFRGEMTAKEIWLKDVNKLNLAKDSGYETIVLWEKDIKVLSDLKLKNIIMNYLKN